jgi:predicted HAD superfamily Cof-like phosphohydrolase
MRFHEAMSKLGARGSVGDTQHPGCMDQAEAELRARMLLEECTETMAALLGRDMAMTMMVRRVHEMEDLPAGGSVEGIADGLADVMVIVLGTAVTVGIDLEPVFNEVMDANDRKCGPGARVRADGKLLKPIDWRGPDVAGVLERQKACPGCGGPRVTEPHVCGGNTWSRFYD